MSVDCASPGSPLQEGTVEAMLILFRHHCSQWQLRNAAAVCPSFCLLRFAQGLEQHSDDEFERPAVAAPLVARN